MTPNPLTPHPQAPTPAAPHRPHAPYPMPAVAPTDADGPPWGIDPHRAALVVQQVQRHLLTALEHRAPVDELLTRTARLIRAARDAGVPVVYVVRVPGHPEDPAGSAGRPGGPGRLLLEPPTGEAEARAVAEAVLPQAGDSVLAAKRCSAFVGTRLRARLKELGRDQVIVTGGAARTDVLLTAADAWMQDLRPFVVGDAVVDRTADDHVAALDWLAATCARIVGTDAVTSAFAAARPADTAKAT
ncbi:isochorismatase family protein [Streptomyces sp. NPDC058417]|uniref:isochorismatase family protein n=1 Tax=unclassified Streptomyces TaxID=2593676 RepID=UPI0036515D10